MKRPMAVAAAAMVLAAMSFAPSGAIAAPQVGSTSPLRNASNIAPGTDIIVTFDQAMNAASINDTTIVAQGSVTGLHAGTITYNAADFTATLNPAADFDHGEVVTVVLTTVIQSSGGTPLEHSYIWSFATEAVNGTAIFDSPTTYAVGATPYAVCAAKLTIGSAPDLAVTCADSIYILRNNGHGAFSVNGVYSIGSNGGRIAAADLDRDGDVDLATATFNAVSVLLNNGDATFAPYASYTVGEYGLGEDARSVHAADFNGDGHLDLATANHNSDSVSVLINNGDGTFGPYDWADRTRADTGVYALCTGDLDSDGDLDVATASIFSNIVAILKNYGDGKLVRSTGHGLLDTPTSILTADLNGDRHLDLATSNGYEPTGATVSVLLNSGSGFGAVEDYGMGGYGPIEAAAGDFDADGDLDLATANATSNDLSVLVNNGSGGFSLEAIRGIAAYAPNGICAVDVDNDGALDLITANYDSDNISVLTNLPQANVTSVIPAPNERSVSIQNNLTANFDVTMDASTINGSTFVVNGSSSGLHSGSFTFYGESVKFDPDEDFIEGETISVTLTDGVKSSQGVSIEGYAWAFTIEVDGGSGTFVFDSEYEAGPTPKCVCAPDVDGDDDADLVVANGAPGSSSVSVFLNLGGVGFFADSTYSVGTGPHAVVAADIDRDGRADIVTANEFDNNVSVLFCVDSYGNFGPVSNYPVGSSPQSVCAADFNRDGYLDLATANFSSGDVSILLNDRTGGFDPPATYPVGGEMEIPRPVSLLSADLDGDGSFDLAVANRDNNSVSVLLNKGNGTFAADVEYPVSGICPSCVVAADLDDDGDLDLVTSNGDSEDLSVLLNNADGTFTFDSNYAVSGGPISVFAGDVDDDGDFDLAVAKSSSDRVAIRANNGSGVFLPAGGYDAGDHPLSICMADLTDDGSLDLVVVNMNSNTLTILANGGTRVRSTSVHQNELDVEDSTSISVTFNTDLDPATVHDTTFVVHARSSGLHQGMISYNSDTRTATLDPWEDFEKGELVTEALTTHIEATTGSPMANSYLWSFMVAAEEGEAVFDPDSTYGAKRSAAGIFAADFNSDGDLDLAVANSESASVSVILNYGNGTFGPEETYPVGRGPRSICAADFDGDGRVDLATPDGNCDSVSVLLNNGDGTFAPHSLYEVGRLPISILAADLNGDGHVDLATANYSASGLSILMNNGDGTFASHTEYGINGAAWSAFAADLDGDADLDLAATVLMEDSVVVLFNEGGGTFVLDGAYGVGNHPRKVMAIDVEGDGYLDLLTINQYSNDVSVLLNNADGTFTEPWDQPVADGPTSGFAADLDGDGDLDLAIVREDFNDVQVLLNEGDGSFWDHCECLVDSLPISVFAADLDGDGTLDLATANYLGGNISVLLNRGTTAVDESRAGAPPSFSLSQNWPNPFNPVTNIAYTLPMECHVKLTIYNVLGQEIVTLVNETQAPGHRMVRWDGSDHRGEQVAGGVYFYRFKAGDNLAGRKMVLLK